MLPVLTWTLPTHPLWPNRSALRVSQLHFRVLTDGERLERVLCQASLGGVSRVWHGWSLFPRVEPESIWNCCVNVKRKKANENRTLSTLKYCTCTVHTFPQYGYNRVAYRWTVTRSSSSRTPPQDEQHADPNESGPTEMAVVWVKLASSDLWRDYRHSNFASREERGRQATCPWMHVKHCNLLATTLPHASRSRNSNRTLSMLCSPQLDYRQMPCHDILSTICKLKARTTIFS